MQTASSRIWTQVVEFTSNDEIRYVASVFSNEEREKRKRKLLLLAKSKIFFFIYSPSHHQTSMAQGPFLKVGPDAGPQPTRFR